ncbi:MAG: pantoate--beta-alanine ligase [Planctomycetia bacterium]|nr:pantoate--beta-alanine ligase [Planctomycetia bacterium]
MIADPERMRSEILVARAAGRRIGFVPTMGALHSGHVSLVDRAAAECDDVAVSIFVNPTQFAPHEDYGRYPRMLEADATALEDRRVRWIFAPSAEGIYPPDFATRIMVDGPARRFEGEIRPGHFSGVATVVCRLFIAVPADVAYFGAKDWQQTLVVKRMVRDLGLPIEITVCPTIREPDGLAMSSRNAYLSPTDRGRATALAESLALAERMWAAGDEPAAIERDMTDHLRSRGVDVDYAAVVDGESLEPLANTATAAVALVAGRLGGTRLIDNRQLPTRRGTG